MPLIERGRRLTFQPVCKILWITDRDTVGKRSCNLESGNGLISRIFALTSWVLTSFLVMRSSPAFFDKPTPFTHISFTAPSPHTSTILRVNFRRKNIFSIYKSHHRPHFIDSGIFDIVFPVTYGGRPTLTGRARVTCAAAKLDRFFLSGHASCMITWNKITISYRNSRNTNSSVFRKSIT
jgi:hypothetical protein